MPVCFVWLLFFNGNIHVGKETLSHLSESSLSESSVTLSDYKYKLVHGEL